MESDQKTALITGATQGLGFEFAKMFAKDGYNLILVARNKEKLNEIAKTLEAQYHIGTATIAKDLTAEHAASEIFHATSGTFVSVLVNNAGFATYGSFAETDLPEELDEIHMNIATVTALTKMYLPEMIKRNNGKLLFVASTAAFQPGPFMAVYYASKAYILSFAQAIAEEVKEKGITVTVLCPGPTRTGFAKRAGMEKTRLFTTYTMNASPVALAGYKGLMQNKRIVIPGILNSLGVMLVKFVPTETAMKVIKFMHAQVK